MIKPAWVEFGLLLCLLCPLLSKRKGEGIALKCIVHSLVHLFIPNHLDSSQQASEANIVLFAHGQVRPRGAALAQGGRAWKRQSQDSARGLSPPPLQDGPEKLHLALQLDELPTATGRGQQTPEPSLLRGRTGSQLAFPVPTTARTPKLRSLPGVPRLEASLLKCRGPRRKELLKLNLPEQMFPQMPHVHLLLF